MELESWPSIDDPGHPTHCEIFTVEIIDGCESTEFIQDHTWNFGTTKGERTASGNDMLVATVFSSAIDGLDFTDQQHTYKEQNPAADCGVIRYALKTYDDDTVDAPDYFTLFEHSKRIEIEATISLSPADASTIGDSDIIYLQMWFEDYPSI